jgi:hypothetical protein
MHLAGAEPKPLLDMKEEDEEVEEDGAAETNAVEGDTYPPVDLQGPRVSTLAMLEETAVVTFLSSSPPTNSEVAWTQRSLVVNTGTLALLETESTGGTDLVPPPLDTPPTEAVGHPNHKSPEQSPHRHGRVVGDAPGKANTARSVPV